MLIPILIGSVIYMEAMSILKREINRSNEGVMLQVQKTIDGKMTGLEKLTTEISVNKVLEPLILASATATDNEQYMLIELMKELRKLKMLNEFVDQVHVYFKNSGRVLSSVNIEPEKVFFGHFDNLQADVLKKVSDERYIRSYIPVEHDFTDLEGTDSVMYVRTLVPDYPDRPGAALIFLIQSDKILEDISTIPQADSGFILIMDENEQVIASTRGFSRPEWLHYSQMSRTSDIFYSGADRKDHAISYTTSELTGWKYVFVTPTSVFLEKMDYLRRLSVGIVMLCLILGCVAVGFFLRRNYGPIHGLLRQVSDQYGSPFTLVPHLNEYDFIRQALEGLAEEKKKVGMQLKEFSPAIRSNMLVQLLRGRLHRTVSLDDSFAALDIRFQQPSFAVLAISIENLGKLDDGADDSRYNDRLQLVYFIITNVLEELAQQEERKHHIYMAEMDSMLACIVNGDDGGNEEWVAQRIYALSEKARSFIWTRLNIHLTIAISSQKKELAELSSAYEEALEAAEYKVIMGGGEIVMYETIRQELNNDSVLSYYYPISMEQKIINCLTAGDSGQSKLLVDEMIRRNLEHQPGSSRLLHYLLAEFSGTLLKAILEMREDEEHLSGVDQRISGLMQCRSIKEMRTEMHALIDVICNWQTLLPDRNPLMEEVRRYVEENYGNCNLNINTIGDAFQITPSYLAKQFKSYTKEALLEFIQRTRLQQAKRLLVEHHDSIQEIARLAGFNEITTFNRTFKKFEGITPGQFREWNQTTD
jgi:AraC-like DNA-binding protein